MQIRGKAKRGNINRMDYRLHCPDTLQIMFGAGLSGEAAHQLFYDAGYMIPGKQVTLRRHAIKHGITYRVGFRESTLRGQRICSDEMAAELWELYHTTTDSAVDIGKAYGLKSHQLYDVLLANCGKL